MKDNLKISDNIIKGYVIRFNEPSDDGHVYTKESIDLSNLERLKKDGILDFKVDDIGVYITKEL